MKIAPAEKSDSFKHLETSLFRLIPPTPHRISLSKKNTLLTGLRDTVCKYITNGANTVSSVLSSPLLDLPFQQPIYSEFLVHSKSVHMVEPSGTVVFMYKNIQEGTTVDVLLTPISLFKLSSLDGEFAPNVHKMANVLYGEDCGLAQLIPDFENHLQTQEFHNHLKPVGILVQNTDSSFLSKVTTVSHGPLYNKNHQEPISLLIPKDQFVDLDDITDYDSYSQQPMSGLCKVYCTMMYILNHGQLKPHLTFFKSGKGMFEVMSLMKSYFTDLIINKIMGRINGPVHINQINFGVFCSLGYTSSQTLCKQDSLCYRGSSFLAVKISDFFVDYCDWKVLL